MTDKQQALFDRLQANLAEYQASWERKSKKELIDSSTEITAVKDSYHYLTDSHGYEPEEIDYLLMFDNPLSVVADKWQERMEDISDLSFALNEVFDKRDALRDYTLATVDKPSVLAKLHAAIALAPAKGVDAQDKGAER